MSARDLLERYAALGLRLVLTRDKRPFSLGWNRPDGPAPTVAQALEHLRGGPAAGVAVLVPTDCVVADFDTDENKAWVEAHLGDFRGLALQKTPHGYHAWFRLPEGVKIPADTKLQARCGITWTVRAPLKNCVVVAPTPGREWLRPLPPDLRQLPELPPELLPAERKRGRPRKEAALVRKEARVAAGAAGARARFLEACRAVTWAPGAGDGNAVELAVCGAGVQAGLANATIIEGLRLVFGAEFDEARSLQVIEITKKKYEAGEPIARWKQLLELAGMADPDGAAGGARERAAVVAGAMRRAEGHSWWFTDTFEGTRRPDIYHLEDGEWRLRTVQEVIEILGLTEAPRSVVSDVLFRLSNMCQVKGAPAAEASRCVAIRNGVFDFSTGALEAWHPKQKLVGRWPVAYIAKTERIRPADNPFYQFLSTYGPEVADSVVCHLLPRLVRPEPGGLVFFFIGSAGCGKTRLAHALAKAITGRPPATLGVEEIQAGGHVLAALEESFINVTDEIPADGLKGADFLKRFATASELALNPKFQAPRTVRLCATMIYTGNKMPYLPEVDQAMMDRLHITLFTRRFRKTEHEIDLDALFAAWPQSVWDSVFSDAVDFPRDYPEDYHPDAGYMAALYARCRDSAFIWATSKLEAAEGDIALHDIVSRYQAEQERIATRARRHGRTVDTDSRGTGTLYKVFRRYLEDLGYHVERNRDNAIVVRGINFAPSPAEELDEKPLPSRRRPKFWKNQPQAVTRGFCPSEFFAMVPAAQETRADQGNAANYAPKDSYLEEEKKIKKEKCMGEEYSEEKNIFSEKTEGVKKVQFGAQSAAKPCESRVFGAAGTDTNNTPTSQSRVDQGFSVRLDFSGSPPPPLEPDFSPTVEQAPPEPVAEQATGQEEGKMAMYEESEEDVQEAAEEAVLSALAKADRTVSGLVAALGGDIARDEVLGAVARLRRAGAVRENADGLLEIV